MKWSRAIKARHAVYMYFALTPEGKIADPILYYNEGDEGWVMGVASPKGPDWYKAVDIPPIADEQEALQEFKRRFNFRDEDIKQDFYDHYLSELKDEELADLFEEQV